MIQKHAKPLRSIFLRSQILVSIAVMSTVTAVLSILLLSLANYIDQRRILDLAQSIESRALIAKNPQYLQQAITQIVSSEKARGVIIFSGKGEKIIAASGLPGDNSESGWLVADKEIRQQITKSLAKGLFGIHLIKTYSHRLTVLPLAPAFNDIGSNVVLGTKWPIPKWHSAIGFPKLSPSTLWSRVIAIFNPAHDHNFKLSADQFAGAIVIETDRNWITTLVLRSIFVISGLMAVSIFFVMLVLSRVLRKNILNPVKQYTQVIAARRAGDYQARVPLSNIIEFDELAYQWNSLLDFRDVAQGQNMVLSTLLEHVPVGIDVIDADGNIEYANPSFLKMTGYSLAEVIGKTPETLLTSSKMDHTAIGDSLVAITNGETWTGEIIYGRKDGTDLICNTTFVPIMGRGDKIERVISVRLDITELKSDERSLIRAKIKAETADKAKSEFLTNMSHELRTPLNAIIGFSEMMAEQRLGPMENQEYVEFSKLIETSSRTLLTSINLILDMSRLDAHRLQLNETRFSVSEMLHKLIEVKSINAQALGVEIKRDLNSKHDIRTDQRMLHQILGYVICNAIRYNNEGGEVLVSVKETKDRVIVSVKDNGIGISEKDLPKVTEPFFRVDSAFARTKDGAGLGLTLAKKFTKEQNIGFEISSELGMGTTVTFTFPFAKDRASKKEKKPEAISA